MKDLCFSTGEINKAFGITHNTLEKYEKAALLFPSKKTIHGYKFYDKFALVLLARLLILQESGVPLKKAKELVRRKNPNVKEELQAAEEALDEEIYKLEIRRQAIRKMAHWDEPSVMLFKSIEEITQVGLGTDYPSIAQKISFAAFRGARKNQTGQGAAAKADLLDTLISMLGYRPIEGAFRKTSWLSTEEQDRAVGLVFSQFCELLDTEIIIKTDYLKDKACLDDNETYCNLRMFYVCVKSEVFRQGYMNSSLGKEVIETAKDYMQRKHNLFCSRKFLEYIYS